MRPINSYGPKKMWLCGLQRWCHISKNDEGLKENEKGFFDVNEMGYLVAHVPPFNSPLDPSYTPMKYFTAHFDKIKNVLKI